MVSNPRWYRPGWLLSAAATGAIAAMLGAASPAAARPAAAAAAAGWPQLQGGASHTGDEAGENSVTAANAGQLIPAWHQALSDSWPGTEPAVTGGVVYVGSGDGVTAFDAASGSQLWQAILPGEVTGTPAIQDGMALIAMDASSTTGGFISGKGYVVALDASTGAIVWQKIVGQPTPLRFLAGATSVTTTPSRAYFSSARGRPVVYALDIHTGRILWRTQVPLDPCGISDPSVSGSLVVVGSDSAVTALNAANGTQAWQDTFDSDASCTDSVENWIPAISQGTVYAGTHLDGVAGISLATGTVLWDDKSLGNVPGPLSLTSNAVITAPLNSEGDGQGLVALNRSDGSVLWENSMSPEDGTAIFGSLAWGAVFTNSNFRRAVAFGRLGGQTVGSTPSYLIGGYPPELPPVVSAGRVYLVSSNKLICFTLPGAS